MSEAAIGRNTASNTGSNTGRDGGPPPVVRRDPGAAPERTALAWQRTALALVVAAVTIGRLTLETLGTLVLAPAVGAAVLALSVVAWAMLPGRRGSATDAMPDGRLAAATAAALALIAIAELAAVVTQLLR